MATLRNSPTHEGMTLRTDTVELKLSLDDAKDVLEDALRYLGGTKASLYNSLDADTYEWLKARDRGL